MSGPEFLAAIEALGLTREAFAARFGLHLSAVYRWTQGTREVPPWVAPVIEMMAERR
jgi:transcriptional regulator with XRE-family HTH domain